MVHDNEAEAMKAPGVFPDGSSCRHTFDPSVRVKMSGSRVKHLPWLHIQLLVVLLATGQASCNQTSTVPSTLSSTTNAQAPAVYYFVDITVNVNGKMKNESEIKAWLNHMLQNSLESCRSPNHNETTVPPTSPQTTSASTYETILMTTASASQNYNTTTAATTSQKDGTITTAASTTLKNHNTNTAATSTALQISSVATTTANQLTTVEVTQNDSSKPSKNPNPNSNSKTSASKQRMANEILTGVTQNSWISTDNTTGLVQAIDMTCMEDAMQNTSCAVMLKLKHSVHPCCILQTLCRASKTSSDIQVVGRKADKTSQLQSECNSNPQEERTCIYNGQTGASCEESGPAYVVDQSNFTHCGADMGNNCSCSAYCSGRDAYYTFQFSVKELNMNISYVLSLISKLKHLLNCSQNADCPLSIVASEYKDANVTCGITETNVLSCRGILGFAREVPICYVSAAVMTVFQSEKQISYTGLVTRAAICGKTVSDDPLKSPLTLVEVNLTPATFCTTIKETNILKCPNGINVVVQLDEQCVQQPFTTSSPNVTTAPQNTTTTVSSVNVTSPPLNTTAESLNTTTTAANTTVTATLNPTTTTTNGSVHVTPSESPTTTLSADAQANALLELTRNVSKLNASQVAQLVSQLENLLSGPTVSLALGNTSVHIVSNLLSASPETLSDSSNRIIGIVDTVALKLVLDKQTETLLSPAVALSVKSVDGSNFQETFFSISDPTNVQVRGDSRSRRSVRNDSSIPQGSIRLPPTLTQNLTSEEQQLVSRVQFNFYQKSTVFQDKSLIEQRLNSGILGASVANLTITGLQDDIVIHLRNTEPIPDNFEPKCVFWDFTLNNGSGGWNTSGCFVRNSTVNETVCSCNHLTSFAILLDLSRQPITSRIQATILSFITYIGCGISAIFLSITLLTYLAFGKLRKDIPSKILIQLCLALLLLNLVFLVDAWLALYPDAVGLCISTAWFLHYFLLVTFTWMGLEAVHMYLALVKVFNSYISHYMVKFSLVGWGIPMIVVIIIIAIDKNNYGLVSYGKFPDGTSDDFCWLKNDIAFYVAVVAYFCVIFLFNLIIFIVVLVQLCRIKRQNPHNALHRTTLQDARSVVGITILLGLTWGFAFFAWGPLNLPFMYLFAIFNSLQGFFIFVFHCAVKENVRRQWRTYLCCGRMRLAENSEWSRTATQKTAKKSSVTRLTSLHSSKSNNSSSSSSFLVSESSEQINGIGSPFEDRAITADEDHRMDVILNEINRQHRNQ
uniref:adhesion G-protein coupled receptor G2 n=1 Tax=Scatophagus argus TaxID=75038 RepID=UPI001ED833F0|nr:adhesion G-protein coupled receptor G2 [Scatophagus argus]XP_046267472.1 adhesion G-protein coupled receptor G2 [Scatophagus argus]